MHIYLFCAGPAYYIILTPGDLSSVLSAGRREIELLLAAGCWAGDHEPQPKSSSRRVTKRCLAKVTSPMARPQGCPFRTARGLSSGTGFRGKGFKQARVTGGL